MTEHPPRANEPNVPLRKGSGQPEPPAGHYPPPGGQNHPPPGEGFSPQGGFPPPPPPMDQYSNQGGYPGPAGLRRPQLSVGSALSYG